MKSLGKSADHQKERERKGLGVAERLKRAIFKEKSERHRNGINFELDYRVVSRLQT